jgi:hypothetical protein
VKAEVEEFAGYEHVFFFHQYYLAARRAGFRVQARTPSGAGIFEPWTEKDGARIRNALRPQATRVVKRYRVTRALTVAYKTLLTGDVNLSFIGVKP